MFITFLPLMSNTSNLVLSKFPDSVIKLFAGLGCMVSGVNGEVS